MPVTSQLPGRIVMIDGKERLYFSGTSYLGISKNPLFQQLLQKGIVHYGTNYGSSRASNLQLAVYEEAEYMLAAIAKAKAALTFSSGYLAGQAVVQAIDEGQTFIYAPGTHPAVWRNQQDAWHATARRTASVGGNARHGNAPHGDYQTWALNLPAKLANLKDAQVVIVANALDPLFAEKYAFDWISQVSDDTQISLLIDDSHGFGVTGKEGAGIYQELYAQLKPNMKLIVVSSLGKALGIPGGVVFGETDFLNTLKKHPFFTAGSPVPPAYLYAFTQAQHIYKIARQQLKTNVSYFQQKIKDSSLFHYFDHYPVFYTPDNTLAKAVEDQCIISSFPYPDHDSQPITRVIINSLHTAEDIDTLCSLLRKNT